MKYLKTYELYNKYNNIKPVNQAPRNIGLDVEYFVDDIVICTATKRDKNNPTFGEVILQEGKKYRVLKIYQLPEDAYLNNPYLRVDVQDIETGEITKGWTSTLFKTEMEFDMGKYNL